MSGSQGEVVKIPIGGGEPSPLTEGINGSWSPDGRQLAFASDRGGRTRVWVSDADGRNAREIGDAELYQPRVAWLPDGRLAWQTTDVRNYRIHDLATGREEYLIADPSVGWVFDPQFSPKGDQVAVAWNRKKEGPGLWVLSWPGRVPRLVSPVYRTPVGWSADGRWIYAYGSRDLVRVDAHTGSVRPVAHFSAGGVDGCDLASDERTVVCALAEEKSDAWLVDHFDPRVPSAKR
jgi:Tol biopolymer transport system component